MSTVPQNLDGPVSPGGGAHSTFFPAAAAAAERDGTVISFKLLILFLLVLYSNVAQVYPQLEVIRPALTIALGAILMMFFELAIARRSFSFMWPQTYMLAGFLGVAAISSFSAIYVRTALDTTTDLAKVVLIYVLMENTVTTGKRIRTVLITLVAGGLFPAVGNIVFYIQGKLVEGSRAAWVGVFANPNESAYALVILVPIALLLAYGAPWWQRFALYAVVGIYLVGIYLTFSRGGLLGLFAVLALFGWRQKSFLVKILMIAVLALGLLVAGVFWSRKDAFDNIRSDTTFNQRIATIKAGLNMFATNPLFGVGPGCSLVAYPLYVPSEAHCGCEEQLVIHNSFIQILSELGALGFIPWMMFIGLSLFQARRLQKNGANPAYALGLELALWGFMVCSLSGGFTYTWFPYILVALVVALQRISGGGTDYAGGKLHV